MQKRGGKFRFGKGVFCGGIDRKISCQDFCKNTPLMELSVKKVFALYKKQDLRDLFVFYFGKDVFIIISGIHNYDFLVIGN